MTITLLDAAILVQAMVSGASNPKVGFEDAEATLAELRQCLNKEVHLPQAAIESALYSCSLLAEQGLFSHPDGHSIGGFIQKLTPKGQKWNGDYSCYEKKGKV